jgi:hypothetical protein
MNEGTSIGQTALREMQDRSAQRRGADHLRESKTQAEAGLASGQSKVTHHPTVF